MEPKVLIDKCIKICEDHKAVDIVVFDVSGKSILADYYMFCSGNSDVHIRAIAGSLEKALKDEHQLLPRSVEGTPASRWMLMDYADVLIHVFHPSTRKHYAIERIHRNQPVIYPEDYEVPTDDAEEAVSTKTGDSRPDFLK